MKVIEYSCDLGSYRFEVSAIPDNGIAWKIFSVNNKVLQPFLREDCKFGGYLHNNGVVEYIKDGDDTDVFCAFASEFHVQRLLHIHKRNLMGLGFSSVVYAKIKYINGAGYVTKTIHPDSNSVCDTSEDGMVLIRGFSSESDLINYNEKYLLLD